MGGARLLHAVLSSAAFAKHARRSTITTDDVKLVARHDPYDCAAVPVVLPVPHNATLSPACWFWHLRSSSRLKSTHPSSVGGSSARPNADVQLVVMLVVTPSVVAPGVESSLAVGPVSRAPRLQLQARVLVPGVREPVAQAASKVDSRRRRPPLAWHTMLVVMATTMTTTIYWGYTGSHGARQQRYDCSIVCSHHPHHHTLCEHLPAPQYRCQLAAGTVRRLRFSTTRWAPGCTRSPRRQRAVATSCAVAGLLRKLW